MIAPEIITFGCRLNIHESEAMLRHARAAEIDQAVIINTCAVTAEAERQARQSIRRIRRERPDAKIIVTGCAAEVSRAVFASMPEIDHLIANDRKLEPEVFAALGSAKAPAPRPKPVPRAARDGDLQRAFVQVQNGCDHRCTFCIIPFGRGPSRSLPIGVIAEEVRRQVEQGFQEVVFTGVDIASYGSDLPGAPSLGQMIRRVLKNVPELPRLRLSSLDPAAIDEDLWALIGAEPRLMPHLHLSLQAGDDLILKRMKRRHSRADVVALCRRARDLRPDMVFGADVIAGFPTEDETRFQNTFDLIEESAMTWLHVFSYSARQGTPAARMPQVHGSLRKARAERLRDLGSRAERAYLASLAGREITVLVERSDTGCTEHFGKIRLRGEFLPGSIAAVKCILNSEGGIDACAA
jgi:threonylcarbamoyladenosine tRNA methylthiotransferase MtaB